MHARICAYIFGLYLVYMRVYIKFELLRLLYAYGEGYHMRLQLYSHSLTSNIYYSFISTCVCVLVITSV